MRILSHNILDCIALEKINILLSGTGTAVWWLWLSLSFVSMKLSFFTTKKKRNIYTHMHVQVKWNESMCNVTVFYCWESASPIHPKKKKVPPLNKCTRFWFSCSQIHVNYFFIYFWVTSWLKIFRQNWAACEL